MKKRLEDIISEDLSRFNDISNYVQKLDEQFIGLGFTNEQEELEGEVTNTDTDTPVELDPIEDEPLFDEPMETDDVDTVDANEDVEELDVTELVNMSKESTEKSKEVEQKVDQQTTTLEKLLNKIEDLESKLGEMDNITQAFDKLEQKFEETRPQTPVEKLELRYLDSGPFNQKPSDYWKEKSEKLKLQKDKHEYVLTPSDIEDYSETDIKNSFTYKPEEDENNDEVVDGMYEGPRVKIV